MSTEFGQAQTFITEITGQAEKELTPQSFSPSQPKVPSIVDNKQMKFSEALAWLIDHSKAIIRQSWNGADASDYAYIGDEGYLMIHRSTGEHLFTVHESDIRGIDWTVLVKPQSVPREVIEV